MTAKRVKNNTARRVKVKAQVIELLGGKCEKCNGVFPAYVYDIHHEDPSNKYREGAQLLDLAWETMLLELSMCHLLCANCHRITHREGNYSGDRDESIG